MSLSIMLPLYAILPRKTKEDRSLALSLNVIRNLDHFSMNNMKKIIGELVTSQLRANGTPIKIESPIVVVVNCFFPNKAGRDLANFAPVAQKFADDAVVEYKGYFEDDNVKYITRCEYNFMGIDKLNPRFEITYKTIGE